MYVSKTQYAKGIIRSSKLKGRQYRSKRKVLIIELMSVYFNDFLDSPKQAKACN
jgi:hypothetical protein